LAKATASNVEQFRRTFLRPGAVVDGDPWIPDLDERAMERDEQIVQLMVYGLGLLLLLMLAYFAWGVASGL
jgi:hypothetical protein